LICSHQTDAIGGAVYRLLYSVTKIQWLLSVLVNRAQKLENVWFMEASTKCRQQGGKHCGQRLELTINGSLGGNLTPAE